MGGWGVFSSACLSHDPDVEKERERLTWVEAQIDTVPSKNPGTRPLGEGHRPN